MYIVLHVNHNVNVFPLGFIIKEPIISSGKKRTSGFEESQQTSQI